MDLADLDSAVCVQINVNNYLPHTETLIIHVLHISVIAYEVSLMPNFC
jgi:hypothetical protein